MALTKLTTDLIDGTIVTSVNGSTGAVTLETGTDWQATPKTADFTAVAGEGYFVDTTSAAITVTLPSSPTTGDEVSIIDYGANASTNNITITSSDNIEGATDDLVLSTDKVSKTLVYSDATKGWLVNTEAGAGAAATPLTVDYLVVAGGGGSNQGAGGAGGLRTSYTNSSSLNGHNESSLNLSTSTDYIVTIGTGGAAGSGNGVVVGESGSNSTFASIISTGGGGGTNGSINGKDGGSGGGGGQTGSGTILGGNAVTSPVTQGFGGGNNAGYNVPTYPGGAGGGASALGGNAISGSTAGDGGAGLEVNIIGGTGNYYAGGGGGGTNTTGGTPGIGGSGGGGNGAAGVSGANGSLNTGGGAGGGNQGGATGGSGIVIIRYPDTYTVTIGAGLTGSTATDGSDKVTTFTAGTGNISFS